jgi:hypothetical protein
MPGNIGLQVVRFGVFRRLIKFLFVLRQAFQGTSAVQFFRNTSHPRFYLEPSTHGSELVAPEMVMQSNSFITWNDAGAMQEQPADSDTGQFVLPYFLIHVSVRY